MAPKAGTSQSTPSALVADAISSLQKAIGTALASAEEQGKADLTRASTELVTLRRERDETLKLLHNSELDCKEWERRGEVWRSSTEKSELTIKHQAETIVQLREEASQWKNQLLRYEEASRREIQDWKEQYLRAEQERARLSARLDQLTAEQLEHIQLRSSQHDPRARTSSMHNSSTAPPKVRKSASKPRASTSTVVPSERKSKPASGYATDRERTYVDGMPRPRTPKDANALSSRTPKPKADQRSRPNANATPRALTSHLEPSPPSVPPSRLIRRVNAIIEVPVKEEEYSDDDALGAPPYEESSGSGSEYVPEKPKRTTGEKKRRSSTSAKGKQKMQQGRYVEIDEPSEQGDESEADQLLIGSDDDTDRMYGAPNGAKRMSSKHRHASLGGTHGSAKKRKLNQDIVTTVSSQSKGLRKD